MGKIKTRFLGDTEVEKKQKEEQKEKAGQKKSVKSASAKVATAVEVKLPKPLKTPKSPKQTTVKPRGKRYQEAKKLVDKNKTYTLAEAIKLLKKMKVAKFDESVELHLNVDETGLRGEVEMPNSIGKKIRIKIVDDKFIEEFGKSLPAGRQGVIDFDILITHPSFMPKLAKYAKVLGPKGLMPNPKAGTVSPNPEQVVKKLEKGTLRWKTEAKFPLIHQMIGKLSHEEKALVENAQVLLKAVGASHIQKAVLKSTMSPAIKLEIDKK